MRRLLLLYTCLICLPAAAQELPPLTEQQLENLGEESPDDDALLQTLSYYRKHPLNLNTATAEEFMALRLLNELQVAALLRYRSAFGPFADVHELQAVPGLDLGLVRRLRFFVVAGSVQSLKEGLRSRFSGGDAYALLRWTRTLERAKGYDPAKTSRYLGDRNRLLLAYRYQFKTQLYYGLVADKDAGEPFLRRQQKYGFDFYSAHLFVRRLGRLKALALGDYTVNLGQGLTQWQSLAFGKSAEVMGIKRQSQVLLPYRSSGEFYFNRGAAATLDLGKFEVTGFLSLKKFSGNLVNDSVPRFSSFNSSGYHRTLSEAADRYRLNNLSAGGNLSFLNAGLRLGLNAVWHRFSRPLQKRDEPYNRFALSRKEAFNASFDYSYTFRNAHVFGEVAVDGNRQLATTHGMLLSLDRRVDISLLYRRFSIAYQAPFGNAFSENSLPGNETGLYTGLVFRPATGWQLAAYADVYRFPFIKYRVSAPTRGWDYLAQISWQPSRQTEIYVRLRAENKPLNESGPVPVRFPQNNLRQNLRWHLATQVSPKLRLRSRAETVSLEKEGKTPERGFLGYAEVGQSLCRNLNLTARAQYFETDGYDSRIYAYESDVLYTFSIPAFFKKGVRYYLLVDFAPVKNLMVWLRLSQTVYRGTKSIGSGLDEIEGNRKTDLHFQLRYSF